jgi:hypothetical protein
MSVSELDLSKLYEEGEEQNFILNSILEVHTSTINRFHNFIGYNTLTVYKADKNNREVLQEGDDYFRDEFKEEEIFYTKITHGTGFCTLLGEVPILTNGRILTTSPVEKATTSFDMLHAHLISDNPIDSIQQYITPLPLNKERKKGNFSIKKSDIILLFFDLDFKRQLEQSSSIEEFKEKYLNPFLKKLPALSKALHDVPHIIQLTRSSKGLRFIIPYKPESKESYYMFIDLIKKVVAPFFRFDTTVYDDARLFLPSPYPLIYFIPTPKYVIPSVNTLRNNFYHTINALIQTSNIPISDDEHNNIESLYLEEDIYNYFDNKDKVNDSINSLDKKTHTLLTVRHQSNSISINTYNPSDMENNTPDINNVITTINNTKIVNTNSNNHIDNSYISIKPKQNKNTTLLTVRHQSNVTSKIKNPKANLEYKDKKYSQLFIDDIFSRIKKRDISLCEIFGYGIEGIREFLNYLAYVMEKQNKVSNYKDIMYDSLESNPDHISKYFRFSISSEEKTKGDAFYYPDATYAVFFQSANSLERLSDKVRKAVKYAKSSRYYVPIHYLPNLISDMLKTYGFAVYEGFADDLREVFGINYFLPNMSEYIALKAIKMITNAFDNQSKEVFISDYFSREFRQGKRQTLFKKIVEPLMNTPFFTKKRKGNKVIFAITSEGVKQLKLLIQGNYQQVDKELIDIFTTLLSYVVRTDIPRSSLIRRVEKITNSHDVLKKVVEYYGGVEEFVNILFEVRRKLLQNTYEDEKQYRRWSSRAFNGNDYDFGDISVA